MLGAYRYDVAGRMITAEAPDTGLFTEFLWDEADRLTQVTDASGTSTIERDADGWTVAFTNQTGIRTVVERDVHGRVVGVRDGQAGDFRLPDSEVVRDPAGRLLIGPDGTVYRYDDAGRLVETAPADQEPTTYEYDADGLIAREIGPAVTRSFDYDAAGRVRAITVDGTGTSGRTIEIQYDAAGRRSTETEPDGTVTEYVWNAIDQLVEIVRTSPSGETTGVRIDLDALGRPQRINDQLIGYDPLSGQPNLVGGVRIVNAGAISWRSDDATWGRTRPDQPDGLHVHGMTLLGARVYDPRTRQFLSADPLMTVPGSNGGASAYTYAWQDPVNFVDPTGLRPVSQEEYDAIREREELGNLGRAWEAIKEDPWGTVAMVGVVAVGVGLMFVPGGQVIGAGILIGAATSAGVGLATGTFDPRTVALSGVIGGISGGVGAATTSTTAAIVTGGALGGGGDLATQAMSGQPIDWRSVGVNTRRGRSHRRCRPPARPAAHYRCPGVHGWCRHRRCRRPHHAGAHRRRLHQLEPGRHQRWWRRSRRCARPPLLERTTDPGRADPAGTPGRTSAARPRPRADARHGDRVPGDVEPVGARHPTRDRPDHERRRTLGVHGDGWRPRRRPATTPRWRTNTRSPRGDRRATTSRPTAPSGTRSRASAASARWCRSRPILPWRTTSRVRMVSCSAPRCPATACSRRRCRDPTSPNSWRGIRSPWNR